MKAILEALYDFLPDAAQDFNLMRNTCLSQTWSHTHNSAAAVLPCEVTVDGETDIPEKSL